MIGILANKDGHVLWECHRRGRETRIKQFCTTGKWGVKKYQGQVENCDTCNTAHDTQDSQPPPGNTKEPCVLSCDVKRWQKRVGATLAPFSFHLLREESCGWNGKLKVEVPLFSVVVHWRLPPSVRDRRWCISVSSRQKPCAGGSPFCAQRLPFTGRLDRLAWALGAWGTRPGRSLGSTVGARRDRRPTALGWPCSLWPPSHGVPNGL